MGYIWSDAETRILAARTVTRLGGRGAISNYSVDNLTICPGF
jgi:hypothetical protein